MKVFIVGIGLIGGSFSIAVREHLQNVEIFGVDASEEHLEEAFRLGLIDQKADFDDLKNADFVYLSIPVDASIEVLPKILDIVKNDAVVVDAGSTKQKICKMVENHPNRRNFLATHPISGTEFSGPKAAIKDLFSNKTNIICEVEKTTFRLQEKALNVFQKIGMRIRYMDPVSHDRHIAYVSHLSHISSFMLGKTVLDKEKNERDIFDLAGSGFESTVRLAKSSPEMWTPIFRQNRENVLETLEEYIMNLQHFKKLLETEEYESVFEEMAQTNHIKEVLSGINKIENLKV